MVIDVSEAGGPTFGAVLPVTTVEGERATRLQLRSAADAIAIVTNDMLVASGDAQSVDESGNVSGFAGDIDGDGDEETLPRGTFIDRSGNVLEADAPVFQLEWCDGRVGIRDRRRRDLTGDLEGPVNLRGVFLVAALATGELQVVDVHDLDATCRGGDFVDDVLECGFRDGDAFIDNARDSFATVERHRPRVGSLVSTSDLAVAAAPSLTLGTSAASVGNDGSGVQGLTLGEITCPAFMDRVFPADGATTADNDSLVPRICATISPYDRRGELWRAEWRGLVPGTGGGAARFEPPGGVGFVDAVLAGSLVVRDPSVAHCVRGVLGRLNAEDACADATAPECGYGGDRLRIADDPITPLGDAAVECEGFYADADGERVLELELAVERSASGSLTVASLDGDRALLERFERCYAPPGESVLAPSQLFESVVTTGDAYAVVGGFTGFLHRVVEGDDGVCTVDLGGQPVDPLDPTTFRFGRARLGELYRNPRLAFRLDGAPFAEETSRLIFTLEDPAADAFVDPNGTAVFTELRYLAEARRLYAVDANGDRLLELTVEPFASVRSFE